MTAVNKSVDIVEKLIDFFESKNLMMLLTLVEELQQQPDIFLIGIATPTFDENYVDTFDGDKELFSFMQGALSSTVFLGTVDMKVSPLQSLFNMIEVLSEKDFFFLDNEFARHVLSSLKDRYTDVSETTRFFCFRRLLKNPQ